MEQAIDLANVFDKFPERRLTHHERLLNARDFRDNKRAFESAERYTYSLSRPDLEALQPVLSGELPLVVNVERAADIEAVLRLAEDFDLDVIIQGGAEAWLLAPDAAAGSLPGR